MEARMTLRRIFMRGKIAFEIPAEPEARTALIKVLSACKSRYNDFVQVTLKTPFPPRTTGKGSQNHHLNGHIMQICNVTGNGYEEIKYCIKMLAVEQLGYPFETIDRYVVPKSERNCDTAECAKLIEAAHIFAARAGIILREAGE